MLRGIVSAFFEDHMGVALTKKLMTRSTEPVDVVLRPDVYVANGDDSYISSGQPVPPGTFQNIITFFFFCEKDDA